MTASCFFPFTHVTAEQRRILTTFFREIRVLDIDPAGTARQPESEEVPVGGLVFFSLSRDRAVVLDRQLADYLSWAQLHRGNEKNLKHLLRDSPYFKTDTDLASIRSQISGGASRSAGGEQTVPDPGLFLKLAQTLDEESEAIDLSLSVLDQGKEALMAELKGENAGTPAISASGTSDQGGIMPDRRMAAWAALAEEAGMFEGDMPLLVTTSPGMFSWLEENAGEVINGLDIDFIKVHENGCKNKDRWLQNVNNLLNQTIAGNPSGREQDDALGENSGCCHLSGQIHVRLFPDGTLNRMTKIPGRQVAVCLVGLNS